jgi:hypothetical protein
MPGALGMARRFPTCFMTTPPKSNTRNDPTGYSYDEAQIYEHPEDEIMALGGDPFFLNENDNNNQVASSNDGLWDGIEDENAYFD